MPPLSKVTSLPLPKDYHMPPGGGRWNWGGACLFGSTRRTALGQKRPNEAIGFESPLTSTPDITLRRTK